MLEDAKCVDSGFGEWIQRLSHLNNNQETGQIYIIDASSILV